MNILIRYNHNSLDENSRWRFIMDGHEIICASVVCWCATQTIKSVVVSNGESITKYHISPINPSSVEITEVENSLNIVVK